MVDDAMDEFQQDQELVYEGVYREGLILLYFTGCGTKTGLVFADKELSFIEENFDYTVTMFDKKAQEALDVIKEEATKDCKAQEAEVVVEESSSTPKSATELYAQELANMRL